MFTLHKERTAETAAKTANLSRKFSRIGNVFAVAIVAMCLFNACKDNEEDEYLSVDEHYVYFDAEGISNGQDFHSMRINTNINLNILSISTSSSWCHYSKTGNLLSIRVDENTSTYSREATLTLSSGSLQATINVSQSGRTGGGGGGTTTAPSAPTGVRAVAQSSSVINISWNAVSGATSYDVYCASSPSSTKNFVGTISENSSVHSGLAASTTYYYYIKAKNSAGESGFSSYAYATTHSSGGGGGTTTAPAAPIGVTASNEGPVAYPVIFIRWNSVSNATSYKVYRASSASGSYSQIGSSTTYNVLTDNNPRQGANYYKVKAVNSAGESGYSDYAYYNNDPGSNLSPCPVTYGNCTATNTTITMRWTVPTTTGCGKPTKAYLRVRHPDSGVYVDLQELSGTATSASFSYGMWANSEGYVYVGIITENSAGTSGGIPKVYNWKTNTWMY